MGPITPLTGTTAYRQKPIGLEAKLSIFFEASKSSPKFYEYGGFFENKLDY